MIDTDGFDDLLREGMAEYTRNVVIAPASAERALRQARRTRQTRLVATATLTAVLAMATPVALHLLSGAPQAGVDVRPAASHSSAALPSPKTRATSQTPRRCGGSTARPSAVPMGPVTVVARMPGGHQQVIWVSTDAELFLGKRAGQHGAITPITSSPTNELNCHPAMFSSSSDAGPEQANTAVRTILFGAVRGRPSRIVVHLPGGDVPAHLVTAPEQLGTLFWSISQSFTGTGQVANRKVARSFGTGTKGSVAVDSVAITVYDGQHVRVHCTMATC
jgi:hypothetical protein